MEHPAASEAAHARLDEPTFRGGGRCWRGWFPLFGEVLWNPEDEAAPYALIFDTRRWTPIPSAPAPRFQGWRYVDLEAVPTPACHGRKEKNR